MRGCQERIKHKTKIAFLSRLHSPVNLGETKYIKTLFAAKILVVILRPWIAAPSKTLKCSKTISSLFNASLTMNF